jgi:inositol hexakisphosphate/diphosphoinositol-pentakisphosphate kinase
VVNGVQINKPLVEKPVDSEDHNIHIYYPMSAGGGCKHLFRKVGDRSSDFFPHEHDVRRDGSYIYEEFVVTQGTDVKVYTVGPDYAHAEARKSPVVDGKVQRDSDKKELRFPVILTPNEKDMARRIVEAFKQTVCGFDILRVHGKSYCCDVNGFSFVKNSRKYYEDAAKILIEIMINAVRAECASHLSTRMPLVRRVPANPTGQSLTSKALANNYYASISSNTINSIMSPPVVRIDANVTTIDNANEDGNGLNRPASPAPSLISETDFGSVANSGASSRRYDLEELRCVIAVIRHGDRTPKQKIKLVIDEPKYLAYYHKYSKGPKKDLKLKSKAGLIEFLKVTNEVISENQVPFEVKRRLQQIRDVLERWEISGINRKLQMKPQKWDEDSITPVSTSIDEEFTAESASTRVNGTNNRTGLATELLVILKWGGDLTPLGRCQAEELGKSFRFQNYPDDDNGGVLRLHATYRHDLKIKASDEGRVMKTAAAFAKGLLELEGQLTPILASLVTIEEKNRLMLDRGGNFEVKEETDRCKSHLNLLQVDEEINDELINKVAPDCSQTLRQSFFKIGNPLKSLKRIHYLIGRLTSQLEIVIEEDNQSEDLEGGYEEYTEVVHGDESELLSSEMSNKLALEHPTECHAKVGSDTPPVVASDIPLFLAIMWSGRGDISPFPSTINNNNNDSSTAAVAPPVPPSAQKHSNCHTPGANSMLTGETDFTDSPSQDKLYNNETFELMLERWGKLHKDFYSNKTNMFDLTKVPDVYDMIRYDILHNSHLQLSGMEELYRLAADFDRCVVPQEYGIDREDKRYIGSKMCGALMEKIKSDLILSANNYHPTPEDLKYLGDSISSTPHKPHPIISTTVPVGGGESNSMKDESSLLYKLDQSHAEDMQINSFNRCVRTRLYFTSESHLHTILNVFRFPKPDSPFSLSKESLDMLNNITSVSYLSQFVIRLFEDRRDPNKYHCELLFSGGVTEDPVNDKTNAITPYISFSKSVDLGQLLGCLNDIVELHHSEAHLMSVKELTQSKYPIIKSDEDEEESDKPVIQTEKSPPTDHEPMKQESTENDSEAIKDHPLPSSTPRTLVEGQLVVEEPAVITARTEEEEMKKNDDLSHPTMITPMKNEIQYSYEQRQIKRSHDGSFSGSNSGSKHTSQHRRSSSFTVQMDDPASASDSWEMENAGLRIDPSHHLHHQHHSHHHHSSLKSRSSYSVMDGYELKKAMTMPVVLSPKHDSRTGEKKVETLSSPSPKKEGAGESPSKISPNIQE